MRKRTKTTPRHQAKADRKPDEPLQGGPASDEVSVEPAPGKEPPQEPPRRGRNEELGSSREERIRHLHYAHGQYSASGQGRFGGQEGGALPPESPRRNRGQYPRGTKMPWPSDEAIEGKPRSKERPRRR